MKVAVTSTNGKSIDTHFGKADIIYVYDVKNKDVKFIEKRNVDKYCSDNPLHAFRPDDFDKVYQAIADCKILYTQKIGAVPAEKCRSLGLKVNQAEGEIKTVLGK